MSTESEIAWAAGLYEGEGTLVWIEQRGYGHLEFKVSQKEREVLDRLVCIWGFGKVLGPYQNTNGNPIFAFVAYNFEDIHSAILDMWVWLSSRRREQATVAFHKRTVHISKLEERNKTCRAGKHSKLAPGRCKMCQKERMKEWRVKNDNG